MYRDFHLTNIYNSKNIGSSLNVQNMRKEKYNTEYVLAYLFM